MYNLKKYNGTYKGLIGEFMFKLTRKWAVLTKCWKIEKYMMIFGRYYTPKQIQFIKENWHSLDCLEICYFKGRKEARLYEIKAKNEYNKKLSYKPKITASTVELYHFAQKIGFCVYFAEVLWKNNWDYEINISSFEMSKFCIDNPKRYDNTGTSVNT